MDTHAVTDEALGGLLAVLDIGQHQLGAVAGQALGVFAAQPRRRAGDDDDLAVERAHQDLPPSGELSP